MENIEVLEELWSTPAFQVWTEGHGAEKENERKWLAY